MTDLSGRKAEAQKAAEAERLSGRRQVCARTCEQISDDAMRDVSVSQIIALSVKAGQYEDGEGAAARPSGRKRPRPN